MVFYFVRFGEDFRVWVFCEYGALVVVFLRDASTEKKKWTFFSPLTHASPTDFCPIRWMFTRTPAHRILCTLVFLTLWFRSCGCDDIPLWLNLDLLIHLTVQICPVWAKFSYKNHYCFSIFTTVFTFCTSFTSNFFL